MSLGYAERLSYREDLGGQLGAPEYFESPEELDRKVTKLAQLVTESGRIIAFTGAGISTSCGIPDFRGPGGIWTLQRAGRPLPRPKVSFTVAKPSFTHATLVALMNSGKLTYIVSQNVDGLHLRSGIPRDKLAELHGNCFAERCKKCRKEYVRDFEVETVGFKYTGRMCTVPGCGGKLHDHVLDWEDALPVDELQTSEQHALEADLAICLGTSLQITPACNLPLKTIRKTKSKETPGKLVIINLQRTQHDRRAEASGGLVIRARTDEVMRLLVAKLTLPVPAFVRSDSVVLRHNLQAGKGGARDTLSVTVESIHGRTCVLPLIVSVTFALEGQEEQAAVLQEQPFTAAWQVQPPGPHAIRILLRLHDGVDEEKRSVSTVYIVQSDTDGEKSEQQQTFSFTTQFVAWEAPAAASPQGAEDCGAAEEVPSERLHVAKRSRAK